MNERQLDDRGHVAVQVAQAQPKLRERQAAISTLKAVGLGRHDFHLPRVPGLPRIAGLVNGLLHSPQRGDPALRIGSQPAPFAGGEPQPAKARAELGRVIGPQFGQVDADRQRIAGYQGR